jgi:hypothetical protein
MAGGKKPLEIIQTCGACPVQYEGRTQDGRVFYFRSRWNTARITVADNIDDAVDGNGWTATEEIGGEFDAGWISSDRALKMIFGWLELYHADQDKDADA